MRHPNDPRPRTVVLLQYTGIGDLIWHIHYFKMIAEQSHGGRVTVVAQPSTLTKAFIGNQPWVESVIDHDHRPRRDEKRKGKHAGLSGMWRMAKQLKAGQFDRIILFSGRISRGLVAGLSGIPIRMGFGYRLLQRIFLNTPPYITAYKGDALAVYPEASAFMVAHGFCQAPVVPRIDVPSDMIGQMTRRLAELPRPLYAFAIGTSELHKQWGIQNFAELAHRLIQKGAGIVLLGGPGETQIAKDIAAKVPEADRHALTVVTDAPVLGSAAALHLADVCVGNDTGMINVAAAVGTKSYVLIGPRGTLNQDPELMHNVRAAKLADITVDRVINLITSPASKTSHSGD